MDSVVHFEMPYENRERMVKFYQSAFDWQTQVLGPEMGNYVLVTTTESTEAGPIKPGAINGGFHGKSPGSPTTGPSVVIAVGDIARSMEKLAASGGKVLGEPMDIPGVGRYVSFVDPEGNRVSLLQPLPRTARG
ncbi:MAG TPA: VOC family protein [Gemmatimonadales bacterium]|nr:VOC family protein [Gemmatimonadales bacterium]